MTQLAVAIFVEQIDQAIAEATLAAERGADVVEFRLDLLTSNDQIGELISGSPLPVIATCRPAWEGGEYTGDEAERIERLITAVKAGAAYVDLELVAHQKDETVMASLSESGSAQVIVSTHDFQKRPKDLTRRAEQMIHAPKASVAKMAWQARSLRDNIEAFEMIQTLAHPTIALCMGEFGLPSRLLAKKFGAAITFAGLNDQAVTAPGQVGVETMQQLYRWSSIGKKTKIYGVIGWPVTQSKSPHLMNGGFDQIGYDGLYVPMPIESSYESFKATLLDWLDFEPLDFFGASVTIPHKTNLVNFVKEQGGEVDPLAERIGAANTLIVGPDRSLRAINTDCQAALSSVCEVMSIERSALKGRSVAIIGAGGVSRAIAVGFLDAGASVTIYNRSVDRATALVDDLRRPEDQLEAQPLDVLTNASHEIYVNATPLGMCGHGVDQTPMPILPASMNGAVAFDTIYNPAQTRWLKEAQAAGARCVSGMDMFVRQAADQFEAWTGQTAPVDHFRQILETQLAQDAANAEADQTD